LVSRRGFAFPFFVSSLNSDDSQDCDCCRIKIVIAAPKRGYHLITDEILQNKKIAQNLSQIQTGLCNCSV
jgi:hypothetical protein